MDLEPSPPASQVAPSPHFPCIKWQNKTIVKRPPVEMQSGAHPLGGSVTGDGVAPLAEGRRKGEKEGSRELAQGGPHTKNGARCLTCADGHKHEM